MGWRNITCAACAALALAWSATARETVKLEYKLKPGMDLIYKFSGTITQGGHSKSGFTGLERFIIADVDPASGVMLVGQVQELKVLMEENGRSRDSILPPLVLVCRLDRSGNPAAPKAKEAGTPGKVAPWKLLYPVVESRHLDAVPLPSKAIAVGDTWENSLESSLPVLTTTTWNTPCKVVSTLAEIKSVDGHKCAVIRSRFTPEPGVITMVNTEEVETVFDMEGGFSRKVKYSLDVNAGAPLSEAREETFVLDSVQTLPAERAVREIGVIRALGAAVAAVYAGEYDKAVAGVEALQPAEVPESWKFGIAWDIRKLQQIARYAKTGVLENIIESVPGR